MRCVRILAVIALGAAFVPVRAWGQAAVFSQPYQYTDADGRGVMTFTPLSSGSTHYSYQPMTVTLTQGTQRFTGSGVYHSFVDDSPGLEPYTLLSFTLVDSRGIVYVFEGRVSAGGGARVSPTGGYAGNGTYWQVHSPSQRVPFQIQQEGSGGGSGSPTVNSSPALRDYWNRVASSDAVGGQYYSTYNTSQAIESTATWTGQLANPGTYRLEVFIPRQAGASSVPRTHAATYQVYDSTNAAHIVRISQQTSSSQWVPLGVFQLGSRYQIILVDQTGETHASRSVVANAVRLTPSADPR
jgi:hypothetical protein